MGTVGEYAVGVHGDHGVFVLRHRLLVDAGGWEVLVGFHLVGDEVAVSGPFACDEGLYDHQCSAEAESRQVEGEQPVQAESDGDEEDCLEDEHGDKHQDSICGWGHSFVFNIHPQYFISISNPNTIDQQTYNLSFSLIPTSLLLINR